VLGGLFGQIGALYQHKISEDYTFNVGMSYTLTQTLRAKKEQHYESYIGDIDDPLYNYKSADSLYNVKGKVIIPAVLALGANYAHGDHWQVGVDVVSSNWKKYRSYNVADSTGSYWMFKAGGSYTPDINNMNNYWRRVTYRAGFYTGQDTYRFNETSLKKSAFTLGMGFPIRRTNLSIGQFNTGFEIGKRGTTDNGLLKENFTRFMVGVTLNDKWFIKRKYD
jgi:hypothetical protein